MNPIVRGFFVWCAVWALVWGEGAMAWPVDWIHDVRPGREKFVKLSEVDWFEVVDPAVAELDWNRDAGELLIVGKKPGRTLVLLGAQGRIAAWRIRVDGEQVRDEKLLVMAQAECPGARASPASDVAFTASIHTRSCYDAVKRLLQTDAFEARNIELVLDAAILQHQLQMLEAALKPIAGLKARARYVGAGLVLEGEVSNDQYRKIMWAVLHNTVGRFVLDDRLVVEKTATENDRSRQ